MVSSLLFAIFYFLGVMNGHPRVMSCIQQRLAILESAMPRN